MPGGGEVTASSHTSRLSGVAKEMSLWLGAASWRCSSRASSADEGAASWRSGTGEALSLASWRDDFKASYSKMGQQDKFAGHDYSVNTMIFLATLESKGCSCL